MTGRGRPQHGDVILDRGIKQRQPELLGCIRDLAENRGSHSRILDQARYSAQRQTFAIAILDGIQPQFGQLVILEAADGNHAPERKIMRK